MKDRNYFSRRDLLRGFAAGAAGLGALKYTDVFDAVDAFAERAGASPSLSKLILAAQKEGHLNVITIPKVGWANYGEVLTKFTNAYKINITDYIPLGSSAQELAAVHAHKGQGNEPDIVDVSPAIAVEGQHQGVWLPYKVSTWSTIPKALKEPKARWYGDYWGTVSFIALNSVVPTVSRLHADRDPGDNVLCRP